LTVTSADREMRERLAAIARAEAERKPVGDCHQSGREIEKYLVLFRETMNRRGATTRYADPKIGYDWCGAFVYFCCLQAGFRISPEPSSRVNGSLAAVRTWWKWARLQDEGASLLKRGDRPVAGDIVLFDRLLVDIELDHMGVVVDAEADAIVTAEGNVDNRAGVFRRTLDTHARRFVRLGSR
jgi:hypothetical protein